MCGLIGFSGNANFNEDKIRFLLYLNQERGKDSLGYYSNDLNNIQTLSKQLGKPEDILIDKNFNIINGNIFIGHTRATTSGKIIEKNAHPFKHGNIVLAMNGTLSNHWELGRKYGVDINTIDVDSEVLCAMLNATQSKEPLTKILGGCAVLYTDTNTNKLYCYRNSDRPLFRGNINQCMYISSIENSLKLIGCDNVKEFKENTLYSIFEGKIEGCYQIKRAIEIEKPKQNHNNGYTLLLNTDGDVIQEVEFQKYSNHNLVGKYLRPKYNCYSFNSGFKGDKDKYYKVKDFEKSNTWEIEVIDDDNKSVMLSKFAFQEHFLKISLNCYVQTLTKIYFDDNNKIAANKDDVLIVDRINKKTITCSNLMTNEQFDIEENCVRVLGNIEAKSLLESKMFEDEDNVINLVNQEEMTTFSNVKELADYTIDNISELLNELKELTNFTTNINKISEIEQYIDNYIENSKNIKEKKDVIKN